jgi:acyl carrier protein
MTTLEIENAVKKILSEDFELDVDSINGDTNLFTELDLDSIDAVDLVVKLQQVIGKKVNPEDFKTIRTLNDVVQAIEKIVNA